VIINRKVFGMSCENSSMSGIIALIGIRWHKRLTLKYNGDCLMKHAESTEFTKQKYKEHRMKLDRIKKTVRQQNQDRQDKIMNKALQARFLYDARNSGE
jgi:hypothetical protein